MSKIQRREIINILAHRELHLSDTRSESKDRSPTPLGLPTLLAVEYRYVPLREALVLETEAEERGIAAVTMVS